MCETIEMLASVRRMVRLLVLSSACEFYLCVKSRHHLMLKHFILGIVTDRCSSTCVCILYLTLFLASSLPSASKRPPQQGEAAVPIAAQAARRISCTTAARKKNPGCPYVRACLSDLQHEPFPRTTGARPSRAGSG